MLRSEKFSFKNNFDTQVSIKLFALLKNGFIPFTSSGLAVLPNAVMFLKNSKKNKQQKIMVTQYNC